MRGAPPTDALFGAAADAELEEAQPLRDNAFRAPLARRVLVRMLQDLVEEAGR